MERRTIRLEVDPDQAREAQSAYLEVRFDRYGNLDEILEELVHLDLEREILLAESTLPW